MSKSQKLPQQLYEGLSDLERMIVHEEGYSPDVYRDSLKKWTVGIGNLVPCSPTRDMDYARVMCGAPWPPEKAVERMRDRLSWIEGQVLYRYPWATVLSTKRKHALLSMAYQLGVDGLRKFPAFLTAAEVGDHEAAAQEMLYESRKTKKPSLWHQQTPARCERMAEMWRKG